MTFPDPQFDNRYRVEQQGFWWWVVRAGTGERVLIGAHTKAKAERMAEQLLGAFRDGEFVGHEAAILDFREDAVSNEQLMKFYDVSTIDDLIRAQCHHVEQLQKKMPKARDNFPSPPRFA